MFVINQATGPIINEIFTNYDIWRYNGRYSGMMGCNSKPWIAEDAALGSEWVGNLQGIVFVWSEFNKIDSRSGVNPKVSKDSPRKLIFVNRKNGNSFSLLQCQFQNIPQRQGLTLRQENLELWWSFNFPTWPASRIWWWSGFKNIGGLKR